MFRDMPHYGKDPNVVVRSKTTFDAPRKWAKSGKVQPGARIFTCSWSDWFIAEADDWRDQAWEIVKNTPQFVYLILTKRPERIMDHLPADWGAGYPNVWLGTSAENQEQAEKRIPYLLEAPASVRFVSAEPLLGPLDLGDYMFGPSTMDWCAKHGGMATHDCKCGLLDWVITGGESALKDARVCDLDWVRSIRNQCEASSVALFHKQHGGTRKIDGVWGGRELDGRTWDMFPAGATVND
jgi:protein gp37